ncbi:DinB superfamily protein [Gracilibacillus orientalis]|uniref:DinB superfamily protein n=1 Tax=Gracilibacillus orientalis TaxID=334253 RepID=A0A1I4LN73_9BACI|nr:DinB family protein [Gracilibacillus orientalis]SFL92037.1 DinB superfamily protein [Gracilibacillus orientalis]
MKIIFDQYKMTRGLLFDSISPISKDLIDLKPPGFRNTIHWQVGHVLVIAEEVANFPHRSKSSLPDNYNELFARGTKPDDWSRNIPSIDQLILDLQDQLNRIENMSPKQVKERLTVPFDGIDRFEEFASLGIFHEAMHLGQILAMQRILTEDHTGYYDV